MRAIRLVSAAGLAFIFASCGGGGDGIAPPPNPTVASVAITTPAAPPTFGALGRTAQFAAEARDAAGAAVSGVTLTWASTNTAVASVNGSGLVTAAGNGSTTITASGGGRTSAGVMVTVSQVGVFAAITPANSTIGALNSTRQMSAQLLDSAQNPLPSAAPVVWSVTNRGTISITPAGLVTAVTVSQPGQADSVLVAVGPTAITTGTALIVTQVPASVVIGVPAGDSVLRTTGRTRQLTATVQDSNANALATQPAINWTSLATAVATVDATGLVTAVADGSAMIQAAAGAVAGTRTQVVLRYPETFTLTPTSGSITGAGQTVMLSGTAQDSTGANLNVTWTSRNTAVAEVNPTAGASPSTATVSRAVGAFGPATVQIVLAAGTRLDSAAVTVNVPASFATDVQPIFTANCAQAFCHTGPTPTGGMDLSSGNSYAEIVNVAAAGLPGQIRVIPGDASNSYLIRKLEGGPNIAGTRMPQGAAPLPQATVNIIRAWIDQGAANN